MTELILKAGKLLFVSSGVYSSYTIDSHFVSLRDITKTELTQIIQTAAEKSIDKNGKLVDYNAMYKVIPLMITAGLLLEIDCKQFYLGEYDEIELFDIKISRPVKGEIINDN